MSLSKLLVGAKIPEGVARKNVERPCPNASARLLNQGLVQAVLKGPGVLLHHCAPG